MTASFVTEGTQTTVTFAYTAPTSKVIETVKAAVKDMYIGHTMNNPEATPFEELTNQEILDFLDVYILDMIIQTARSQLKMELINEAMRTAEADAELVLDERFIPPTEPVEPLP